MPAATMTPASYLASLPADRKRAMTALRALVRKHLPKGYQETCGSRMLVYSVPLAVYPDTYNKQPLMYAALASQKNYMALYLCNAYGMPELKKRLEARFKTAGKRLDMGKSCVRFKRLDDLELPAIADVIAATPMTKYIEHAKSIHAR